MKEVYIGRKDIFYNSDCLFIEYEDILKSPQFFIFMAILDNPEFNSFYDLEKFKLYTDVDGNQDMNALYEWYINREHQNFLLDLTKHKKDEPNYEKVIESTENLMITVKTSLQEAYTSPWLNFANVVTSLLSLPVNPLVHNTIVWCKHNNEFLRKDLFDMFGDKVKFMPGDFKEVIKSIPTNTTYVFSDIEHVKELYDEKHLELSSVILSANYGYNKINGDLKYDLSKIQAEVSFKYDFFDNIHENQ